MTAGEICCSLNHAACWEHASKRKPEYVVVMEDDAVIVGRLLSRISILLSSLARIDREWGLLYLGRERIGSDRGRRGEFVVPGFSYCTYGYVLSRRGLAALLGLDLRRNLMPVDEFLPASFLTHPRRDVRALIKPNIKAYAVRRDMVRERNSTLSGSETGFG